MEDSLNAQIEQINQRLSNIERSIEILMRQTKAANSLRDFVYVRGTSGAIGDIAPQIKSIVQR